MTNPQNRSEQSNGEMFDVALIADLVEQLLAERVSVTRYVMRQAQQDGDGEHG